MSVNIEQFTNLEPDFQKYVAELVCSYTNGEQGEKPQMLPMEESGIFAKHVALVALNGDQFAGFISASKPEGWQRHDMSEVGSLWVPKKFRGRGYAHELVGTISESLVREKIEPYAFVNLLSSPIFRSLGYTAARCFEVPSSAFDLCENCPSKPNKGCCDQPLVYKLKKEAA